MYLEDEEYEIEIDEEFKIKLFGTPWTAEHGNAGSVTAHPTQYTIETVRGRTRVVKIC